MPGTAVWTLRETLIVAVLGAVFGVLYLGWVQVWLIVQATQNADFALAVCDKVAVLAEGRIIADGPARHILRDTALLQAVGLAPPEAAPLPGWMEQQGC